MQNCSFLIELDRESVVASAFLDPLTARRLVPHIRDDQIAFAASNDVFTANNIPDDSEEALENTTDSSLKDGTRQKLHQACAYEVLWHLWYFNHYFTFELKNTP